MITDPNLPIAEQNPNPVVLTSVPKDYVVSGYNIWKHSFMKNLLIEDTRVICLKQNIVSMTPAIKKKITKDLFLPKAGWSIITKDRIRAGASPITVNM